MRKRFGAWREPMLRGVGAALSLLLAAAAQAQKPPLLPEKDVAALANELSGETAKRNLEGIARFHRQRGSQGFHAAAELVAEQLRAYGLSDVAILQFPADGKIFYGTQRSRPAWDAEVGELAEINPGGPPVCDKEKVENGKLVFNTTDCFAMKVRKIASYEAAPIVLAEDSESADVTAELVNAGEGTKESDYAGKVVKGKIVLVSAQPGAVQDLAVAKFGAAGIVSYAQNQKTAWSGEDENLIRWGHLETFSPNKTFAFMVSLKTARGLQERLARGELIHVHAVVKAGQHPGNYEVVTATIPGADPKLKEEEIAFSCHLDHQRPGANDNASGCVTILEVARSLHKLIDEKKLARPARTIRFIFPPEVEGTMALLNAKAPSFMLPKIPDERTGIYSPALPPPPPAGSAIFISGPELAKRIKAVVHMDMVGGGPETKAVFHVTRGPMSLPSFVHDVAWAFADWLNDQSYRFAAGLKSEYPMVAPEGGKEPLRAEYSPFSMGSDHDVYQDSSFSIPAIYLNDWPDRYIHTNFDTSANIDPTKLKRAAFIGAASGYFLATAVGRDIKSWAETLLIGGIDRDRENWRRGNNLNDEELQNATRHGVIYTSWVAVSAKSLFGISDEDARFLSEYLTTYPWRQEEEAMGDGPKKRDTRMPVFVRKPTPRGPLAVFGYDYFADHAKTAAVSEPKLLSYEGLWGSGEEFAYEVLNFADGKRNAQEIRDAVSAEYGPVPLDLIVEYLKALETIGIVEKVQPKP
jgi:aminopeptidase YwaD